MAAKSERTRYPVDLGGKELLAAAARRRGLGPVAIGKAMGVSHAAITQLFADGTTTKTKPTWSCGFLPELCQLLGVSFYAVAAGLQEDEKRLLRALALVTQFDPDRADGLVAQLEERARDIAKAAGWDPSESTKLPRDSAIPMRSRHQ